MPLSFPGRLAAAAGLLRARLETASPNAPPLSPGEVHRLAAPPTILHQGQTNSCGPYALAMAAGCFWPGRYGPEETARHLARFRVPRLGATMPWGIVLAGQSLGLDVRGHWLGRIEDLKRCVDAGYPALVIVRPDDLGELPWYTLHYRVLVGYRDDPTSPGDGDLCFACSASWSDGLEGGLPGNVALRYGEFRRQWRTWLTVDWWAEVALYDESQ